MGASKVLAEKMIGGGVKKSNKFHSDNIVFLKIQVQELFDFSFPYFSTFLGKSLQKFLKYFMVIDLEHNGRILYNVM